MNISTATPKRLRSAAYRFLQADITVGLKLRAIQARRALTILNFHRVSDRNNSGYAPMVPAVFDELVGWLKQRFSLVGFGDLRTLEPRDKPPLVLSFDDGYKDFIEIAAPILDKHRVRVNHNIVPGAVESGRPPMNVALQDFIASAPTALLREIPLPGLPRGADPNNREHSCLLASAAFKNKPIAAQKSVFVELDRQFARFDAFRETPMMSLEDLRQIASVHEIGAHSFEHASMAVETDDYLREDTRNCREYFESRLGFLPKVYAFPNGSLKSGQAEIVRSAGFEHVLLVGEDYSRRSAWLHYRFTMHGRTVEEARARALGWFKRAAHVDAG